MKYKFQNRVLEFDLIRNPDLAFLFAASAVYLDLATKRKIDKDSADSIDYLACLLDEITQREDPEALRSANSYVLAHAIFGDENGDFGDENGDFAREYFKKKSSHVKEILLQTNLVAKELRNFKSRSSERLETLSDFCMHMSQEISCFQEAYYPSKHRLIV